MKYPFPIPPFAALVLLAPVLAALSGCGNGEKAAEKGEAALRDGKYAVAAKALDTAARKTPPTSHLYYNLGAAKALSGDAAGAVRAFENAESENLANLDALEYRAHVLAQGGDYVAAHELLDRAIDEAAEVAARARILNALAVAEHALHRDDLACLRLGQAIRLAPDYAPAYFNFAHILEEAYQLHGEAQKRIEAFIGKAAPDDPRLPGARDFLAEVKAAAEAATPPPHTTTAAANALIRQGKDAFARSRMTLAEEHFAKALEADPESFDAAFHLATTRFSARHYDAAAEAYAKAAALAPDQFTPLFMQAHIAYTSGQYARATQLLTGVAVPRWPDEPANYDIAAYALFAQQRYYEARLYGLVYRELAGAAGTDLTAFDKWFATIPQIAFQPDK